MTYATKVLQAVDEMEQSFKPILLTGTVVIGVPDDYYLFVPITEALRGFMIDKPGIAVEMRAGLAVNHLRDLRDGTLDLALIREVGGASGQVLRTERMVWIASPSWAPPLDGVIPLAAVNGGCCYRKVATSVLDENDISWTCKFSCTSLEGVLAAVRAGMAVSVVTAGDVKVGVREIEGNAIFPRLPPTTLSIKYSEREPSTASKALARTIANVLASV